MPSNFVPVSELITYPNMSQNSFKSLLIFVMLFYLHSFLSFVVDLLSQAAFFDQTVCNQFTSTTPDQHCQYCSFMTANLYSQAFSVLIFHISLTDCVLILL